MRYPGPRRTNPGGERRLLRRHAWHEAAVERARPVGRALDDPEARLPGRPGAQRRRVELAPASAGREEDRRRRAQLALDELPVETGLRPHDVQRAADRVPVGEDVPARKRAQDAADLIALVLERRARHRDHEVRVAWRAVAGDLGAVESQALAGQRYA